MPEKESLQNAGIEKWLESLGYPAASLRTPMDTHIARWWSYLTCEADFFTVRQIGQDGKPRDIPIRSCTPADMVTDDMAGLIFNEKASISLSDADEHAQKWLQRWLARTAFQQRAPWAVKRMCVTGTAAWALHVKHAAESGRSASLQAVPMRYDARSIVPLEWDDDECAACAFTAKVYIRGSACTQVEVHRRRDDGNYEIACAFFDDQGDPMSMPGYLGPGEALDTRQPHPTFGLFRLALDNRYWDYSPMGVSLYDNAIGELETVDLAFDNLGNDIFLGKKMLVIPEAMMRKDEASGDLVLPWMEGQQFFLAAKSNTYNDSAAIYEYNPSLRAEENRQNLATALQMLGKAVGFGMKAYALDSQGGITTAKQVASDNAEMMRTVRRHEKSVEVAVKTIVTAAAGIYRELSTEGLPDVAGAVEVALGDSIMQDEDTLRERDRADVAAGLLEPWKYMVRWQGYSEDEAKAAQDIDAGMRDVPMV